MHVWNVRYGLATNSSSTHSIIFRNDAEDRDVSEYEFGWEFWTAASKESRQAYVALILYQNLRNTMSKEAAVSVVKDWCNGFDLKTINEWAHVDHQSVYVLPQTWNEKGTDKEFFLEFQEFLLEDGLVILGGNDNEVNVHKFDDGNAFCLALQKDNKSNHVVARKDMKYNFWTIFNRKTGTKIRMKFGKDSAIEPQKASAPELVDLKITDYCPFDCAFCYQDSTSKGNHASKKVISNIVYALKTLNVFEVAIGGGEPTMHPDFISILRSFSLEGIVPNFTTKSLHWLNDPAMCKDITSLCGAFAYSVTSVEDVENLVSKLTHNGIKDYDSISIQYVMGSTSIYEFEEILNAASYHNIRITLLGYKTTGRGDKFKPHEYSDCLKIVEKMYTDKKYVTLGIDTALAADPKIDLSSIPSHLYTTEEGKFSMYIDAVTQKMGASSYVNPLMMRPFDSNETVIEKNIYKTFASF